MIYIFIGFIISVVSVPLIAKLASKANVVDVPDSRKIHTTPTPLLGGLGIFLSYIIIILLLDDMPKEVLSIFAASTIILALGLTDDIFDLSPYSKLVVQTFATSVIILNTELRFNISVINLPFFDQPIWTIILTYLWIIGVTNSLNLIDGINGLSGGVSLISFTVISIVAHNTGSTIYMHICLGFIGATAGFLKYNITKAKVFMGDSGSLLLGFNLACFSIASLSKNQTIVAVIFPISVLSIPIFDTLFAIIRRSLDHRNPLLADKGHLHHILIETGLTHLQALTIFYALSILMAILSYLSYLTSSVWYTVACYIILLSFLIIIKGNFKTAKSLI
ncbi:MAG: undecaprenyl-phosphate alpha-N-acetylglucosaminyl 1-phosphate transferase [Denitrovibrio sp.]|nr:MAG: undecaprenyl-phosphate alpha-N-acetylglucosaminyl 1-phosphate transferase [Denitrovibrio sp.]